MAELTFGAYFSDDFDRHIKEPEWLRETVTVLDISDVFDEYAQIRCALKRKKRTLDKEIGNFDILIGATALHYGLTIGYGSGVHLRDERLGINGLQYTNALKDDLCHPVRNGGICFVRNGREFVCVSHGLSNDQSGRDASAGDERGDDRRRDVLHRGSDNSGGAELRRRKHCRRKIFVGSVGNGTNPGHLTGFRNEGP